METTDYYSPQWPIKPSFISLVDGADESSENLDINTQGMFYPDYIQGFLGSLANDEQINNPLTLYQIVPMETKMCSGSGAGIICDIDEVQIQSYFEDTLHSIGAKLIRMDSGKQFPIKECCEIFRDIGSQCMEFCYKQDSRVMLLLHPDLRGIKKEEFKTALESLVKKYNEGNKLAVQYHIHVLENKQKVACRDVKTVYLRYQCPVSQLDEYIFPVFYDTDVVACLMQGQTKSGRCDPEKAFPQQDLVPHKSRTELQESLEKLPKENDEECKNRIDTICKRIETLERRIYTKVESQRQKYINASFNEIRHTFQDAVKIEIDSNKLGSIDNAFEKLKEYTTAALNTIISKFTSENEFIRLYYINTHSFRKEFKLLASSNEVDTLDRFRFLAKSEEFLTALLKQRPIGVTEVEGNFRQKLIDCYTNKTKGSFLEKDALRILITLSPDVSILIWKRYGDKSLGNPPKIYRDRLNDFYIMVSQTYAVLKGIENEKMLENVIRIAGHEVGNMLPRMIRSTKEISERLVELDDDRARWSYNKVEDLLLQLQSLENIYRRPSLMFKQIEPKREWKSLDDILKLTAFLFRPLAQDKNNLIPPHEPSDSHIQISVEEEYFEHIIFNLLDNAVKYAYEGTNIYMKVREENGQLKIDVTSYGAEIKKEDPIYDLYVRGSNQRQKVQGLGVGMFLAQKIALAHDFELNHNSKRLSDFHLPVYCYLVQKGQTPNGLTPTGDLMKEVVALDQKSCLYQPGTTESALLVNEPTFRNTFTITIKNSYYKLTAETSKH